MAEASYEMLDDHGPDASNARRLRAGFVCGAGIFVGVFAVASVALQLGHGGVDEAIDLDAVPVPSSWFLIRLGLSLAIGAGLGLSLGCNVGQPGPGLVLGIGLGLAFALGFAVLARALLTSAFMLEGLRMVWEFQESASRLQESAMVCFPAAKVTVVLHAAFLVASSLLVASGSSRGSIGCAALIAYLVVMVSDNVRSCHRRGALAETRREERYQILRSVSIAGALLCAVSYNMLEHQEHELQFGTPPDSQEVYANRGLMLAGRSIFALVFASGALECAMEFSQVADMLGRKGMPVPQAFAGIAIVLSVLGVVLVIAHDALNILQGSREVGGFSPVSWAGIGSWLLLLVLAPTSVIIHVVQTKEGRKSLGPITMTDNKKLSLTSTKANEDRSNWTGGVKSLSIVGSLLFFIVMEP